MSLVHILTVKIVFGSLMFCHVSTGQSTHQTGSGNVTTLNLLALGPYPSNKTSRPSWAGGPALIPAALLAAELINNDSSLLPGYHLNITAVDSGCNLIGTLFVNLFQEMFYSQRRSATVGIVGPGCSEATLSLAPIIVQDEINLMQISIASTPEINASMEYDNTFRTVSSAFKFIATFSSLSELANWNHFAVLYDDRRRYHTAMHGEFQTKFMNKTSRIYSSGVEDHLLKGAFDSLENLRLRIIFVFAGQESARKVLCVAHDRNMLYPSHQWIFTERSVNDFLRDTAVNLSSLKGNSRVKCNQTEMKEALNGSMLSEFQFKRVDDVETVSHLNLSEYDTKYENFFMQHLEDRNLNLTEELKTAKLYTYPYFDATWAFALALNSSLAELDEKHLSLLCYNGNETCRTRMVGDVIKEHIQAISFEGIGGKIMYDHESRSVSPSTGVRVSQVDFRQKDNKTFVCLYITASCTNSNSASIAFVEDEFKSMITKPPLSLGVIILIVAAISFVAISTLHFLYIYHSDKKSIKATSPYLTSLIFSGSYMSLVAVFLLTVRETFVDTIHMMPVNFGVLCSTFIWCSMLSITLIFGTLCVKTWRIYRIFNFFRQGRVRYVSNGYLLCFIVVLLLIDTVYLVAWNMESPWRINAMNSTVGDDLIMRFTCVCDDSVYWLVPLVTYKGVLIATVVYLSILIRHIKRKEFDFTKHIVALIYLLLLLYAVLLPIHLLFTDTEPLVSFLALNFLALSTVYASCAFLFIPPLRLVWTYKKNN